MVQSEEDLKIGVGAGGVIKHDQVVRCIPIGGFDPGTGGEEYEE
jgi:hypothetical protein